jgi:hypothetical protein
MTVSDQPDIKLAVLEKEFQDVVQRGIGDAAVSTGYSTSMNIVRGLVKRITALKEDVIAIKTRQAQAHSVDEALLNEDDFNASGC